MKTTDPLKPTPSLLCKLGSIVVHADEGLSSDGHAFDMTAMRALLDDPEVRRWLADMDELAMIPKKRKDRPCPPPTPSVTPSTSPAACPPRSSSG